MRGAQLLFGLTEVSLRPLESLKCVLPEPADVLEEEFVLQVEDLDLALLVSIGFPALDNVRPHRRRGVPHGAARGRPQFRAAKGLNGQGRRLIHEGSRM
jgi:hypothetical protein